MNGRTRKHKDEAETKVVEQEKPSPPDMAPPAPPLPEPPAAPPAPPPPSVGTENEFYEKLYKMVMQQPAPPAALPAEPPRPVTVVLMPGMVLDIVGTITVR